MEDIRIEKIYKLSDGLLESINMLLHQLNEKAPDVSEEQFQEMVSSSNYLFICHDTIHKKIIGMAMLIIYQIPFGKKAIIEDFVIDASYRGKGIGSKFFQYILNVAKRKNVRYIELTSNPSRKTAAHMYVKNGFFKRDTNVYRLIV